MKTIQKNKEVSKADLDTSNEEALNISKRELNKQKWFAYFCELAESKGGRVTSTQYDKMHSKMAFVCKENHAFTAKCHDVRQKGTWCPKCAGNERLSIDKLREAAAENGGVLLSQAYIGLDIDHVWACTKGHQFSHTPLNVLYNKAWCPLCRKEENKIKRKEENYEAMALIAAAHEGKLISTKYVNSRSALELQCKNGHLFTKTPEKLKSGEWCPHCTEEDK